MDRRCTRARSWTTPLAFATINTFCSGTSIGVAAFTSWTPPLAPLPCCAMRGRRFSKYACMTLSNSKVDRLACKPLLVSVVSGLSLCVHAPSHSLSPGSNACRVHNGGCTSLCLAIPGGRQCACAEDQILDPTDNTSCKGKSQICGARMSYTSGLWRDKITSAFFIWSQIMAHQAI